MIFFRKDLEIFCHFDTNSIEIIICFNFFFPFLTVSISLEIFNFLVFYS